ELGRLPALLERLRQPVGIVEVIFHRGLGAARDEDELFDPRRRGLLDRVLDERLVDEVQHLLRHGLRRRQKPGTEAADRKDGLADFLLHYGLLFLLDSAENGWLSRMFRQ